MRQHLIFLITLLAMGSPDLKGQNPFIDPAQVDSIFAEWNSTHVPGGAVAVIHDSHIQFKQAYGMASLEYGVPNTPETIFNLASISKQFTAFGLILMEQQGLLSLDDPIQQHLPEIPDFGEPLTLRHMLHHTSGLRSLHALLHMAGWREDDRRSNADIMRFTKRQTELNFSPGSEYLYCNTGYMLAAEIIERKSGQDFETWMKEHIYDPLEMDHSFCRRDINEVIPNVATSYYVSGSAFRKAVPYWAYIGSGNMHSTLEDLAKWLHNFREPKLGGPNAIERLLTQGRLNNGDTLNYAMGINVGTYRGIRRISHGGSIGGFRSHIAYFPDQDWGVIVLSNASNANASQKAMRLADLYLAQHMSPPPSRPNGNVESKAAIYELSDQERASYTGTYYSPELDTYYSILQREGELYLYHYRLGETLLEGRENATLHCDWLDIQLSFSSDKRVNGLRMSNGRARNVWFSKVP